MKDFLPTWPFNDRVLARHGTATAIPGYAPQVFPYILVLSDRHVTSFADLDPGERRDIFELFDRIRDLYDLNALTVFEHAGCRSFGGCIEHVHMHVIDGRYDLVTGVTQGWRKVHIDRGGLLWAEGAYLFVGRYSGGVLNGFCAPREEKEDQYFRRVLARKLGDSYWDWRIGFNKGLMEEVYRKAVISATT